MLREEGIVFPVDVQNRRTVRHSRLGVRDIEREASPTTILAVPYSAHSYRW